MTDKFTRRDFLKAGGLGLAGAGLTMALAPAAARAAQSPGGISRFPDQAGTNATYFNDAAFNAADPYVLHDERSGFYYAYSTDGGGQDAAERSYFFGIYRSADLATWEQVPGGALPTDDPNGQGATVTLGGREAARLTLTYGRQKASGAYEDVYNLIRTSAGKQRRVPVSETVLLSP